MLFWVVKLYSFYHSGNSTTVTLHHKWTYGPYYGLLDIRCRMTGYFPNLSLFHFPLLLLYSHVCPPSLPLVMGDESDLKPPLSLIPRHSSAEERWNHLYKIKVFSEQTLILLWLGRGWRTRSSQNLEAT